MLFNVEVTFIFDSHLIDFREADICSCIVASEVIKRVNRKGDSNNMSEIVSLDESSTVEKTDGADEVRGTVLALLDAAGLSPDADELGFFVSMYPELRAGADRLYGYGGDLEPAPVLSVSHLYEEGAHS